ncbi:MAG: hypothetical protein VX438_18325 [Planctomycetota bacterium]|nr:hypothetical protein [Planctomycetota bacterium]
MPRPANTDPHYFRLGTLSILTSKLHYRRVLSVLRCAVLILVVANCVGCESYLISKSLTPPTGASTDQQSVYGRCDHAQIEQIVHQLLAGIKPNEKSSLEDRRINGPVNICFVNIYSSAHDSAANDSFRFFKEQLSEKVNSLIQDQDCLQAINRQTVEAALRLTRLHPEDLLLPDNLGIFVSAMKQSGQPFKYLLSGSLDPVVPPREMGATQVYRLSLRLIDVASGQEIQKSVEIHPDSTGPVPSTITPKTTS